jgi:hypothetical protein
MNYLAYDDTGGEITKTPELDALVVAYVAYWLADAGSAPRGQHYFASANLLIEFTDD